MECNCEDYQLSMPQIDAAQTLADVHGMKYTGKVIRFCPWCGMPLTQEGQEELLRINWYIKAKKDVANFKKRQKEVTQEEIDIFYSDEILELLDEL